MITFDKINNAYSMLCSIKCNFIHTDKKLLLCNTKLWFALSLNILTLSGTHTKKLDIADIEKIKKRATKLVISFKKRPYKEHLIALELPTLKVQKLLM